MRLAIGQVHRRVVSIELCPSSLLLSIPRSLPRYRCTRHAILISSFRLANIVLLISCNVQRKESLRIRRCILFIIMSRVGQMLGFPIASTNHTIMFPGWLALVRVEHGECVRAHVSML